MSINPEQPKKTIGIVGGGKAGLRFLNYFINSPLTRVAWIMDINPGAPGVTAARSANIKTVSSLESALASPPNFIIEVTGSNETAAAIQARIPAETILITHEMAFIILNVIQETEDRSRNKVVDEITGIRTEIQNSLGGLGELVEAIDDVTSEMNMIAINARIEAARVGEHGKGFGVVAASMTQSTLKVAEIVRQINQVSQTIEKASVQIDASLEQLK